MNSWRVNIQKKPDLPRLLDNFFLYSTAHQYITGELSAL
ncbi:hypothetical protein ADIS_3846 [Lunatimonas lonarensis]|uniref:Uncharacterized protein n=1 Tax=Lunatimonas lonarensis TaxID=1232681 RepID=R7ZNJ8_9BACT|nr:hypothetical protein ADIS_3846 [Lunatimonas lonarensis]